MNTYILKYVDQENKYAAVDDNSGGYPYAVEWHRAQIYTDIEQAKRYAKMFGFLVCRIKAEINGVIQE